MDQGRGWRVLDDLWLTARARPRSLGRSLIYLFPIALLSVVLYRGMFREAVPYTSNHHAMQSIDAAVNAHFCGQPSRLSSLFSPQALIAARPDLLTHRFNAVLVAGVADGTRSGYCRTLSEPVVLSENSLMWLTRFALAADGRLTPGRLGAALAALRVAMLLIFALALLRSGSSVLLTAAAVLTGCAILNAVEMRDTIYPFILTLPLLTTGVYALASASARLLDRRAFVWAFAGAMGLLMGFSGSMRTVMLPVSVAMFGLFLFALSARPRFCALGSRVVIAGAVAAFVASYIGYVAVFIYPLHLSDSAGVPNAAYHTVSHQLVLGLAVPENDLSRREGLEWRDEIGFAVARRMSPSVSPYGPEYDALLFRYYRGLWRSQPRAMVSTYLTKLRSAGTEVFLGVARIGRDFRIPAGPAEWLHRRTNGLTLIGLAFITFVFGLFRYRAGADARFLTLSFVGLAALVALAESFLTYSLFVGMYFSELLFFVIFLALFTVQAALDTLVSAAQAATGRG